jgi:hypothetical protein
MHLGEPKELIRMRRIAAVLGAGLLTAALTASAAGAAGTTTSTTAPHKPNKPKAVHTRAAAAKPMPHHKVTHKPVPRHKPAHKK